MKPWKSHGCLGGCTTSLAETLEAVAYATAAPAATAGARSDCGVEAASASEKLGRGPPVRCCGQD
eukprot:scaffold207207_cov35-Tisochrysis_lutea.AAC.1